MSDPSEAGAAAVAAAIDPATPMSVVSKLRAHKAARAGDDSLTLPETGVVVTLPRFKPYSAWAQAQRMGGTNQASVMVYFITALAKFDGERLTFGDYQDLIPSSDHVALLGKIYSGDADVADKAASGDAAGN